MSNTPFFVDSGENGEKGWWNHIVGHGKEFGIDLNEYDVMAASPIGSPFGSTSPLTVNRGTGEPWGNSFPVITPLDMARMHKLLLEHLGIEKVNTLVGGSMGGMQVLQFASEFPSAYERCVAVASTGHTSPGTVALRYVQRQAVLMDEANGLRLARMIGTIGYRSRKEFDERFSWLPVDAGGKDEGMGGGGTFQVENYLHHQADRFERSGYDADCYRTLSKAMDLMSLDGDNMRESIVKQGGEQKEFMLLPYSSDMLMPPNELKSLGAALGKGREILVHVEILPTLYGHDAFLIGRPSEALPLNERLWHFLKGGIHEVRRFHGSTLS
jgi:homoserine O-acetyltransferase